MVFKEEIWEFITECLKNKTLLEPYFGTLNLQGFSGNWWKPDIVIVASKAKDSEALGYGVKLIGEIKMQDFPKSKPKRNTHTEHMWRAYARFGDMKNWQVPKYLLFPYLIERRFGFDFNTYFRSIDVILLDWSKTEHCEMLKKQIDEL
jgi:hypothetical protein